VSSALKLLFTFISRFTRTASSPKEIRNTLAKVSQAIQSVGLRAVEASNEGCLIIGFSPAAFHTLAFLNTVSITECTLDVHPFTFIPDTALHLAALGHLQAVQGVAMTTEQTSNKVILAAQLATFKIKLLPPILVVAMLQPQVLLVTCTSLTRARTLSGIQVVQGIASTITLDANQQEVTLAGGPTPLVKRTRPV